MSRCCNCLTSDLRDGYDVNTGLCLKCSPLPTDIKVERLNTILKADPYTCEPNSLIPEKQVENSKGTLAIDTDGFRKADNDKNRLELIEPRFIKGVGSVLTMGASKYGDNNWKEAKPSDVTRIKGALLRHVYAYLDGDKIDDESNKSHLYHIGCNLMFLDYFDNKELDDNTEES